MFENGDSVQHHCRTKSVWDTSSAGNAIYWSLYLFLFGQAIYAARKSDETWTLTWLTSWETLFSKLQCLHEKSSTNDILSCAPTLQTLLAVCLSVFPVTPSEKLSKIKWIPKNEDNLKKKDNHINEEDYKSEDNPRN